MTDDRKKVVEEILDLMFAVAEKNPKVYDPVSTKDTIFALAKKIGISLVEVGKEFDPLAARLEYIHGGYAPEKAQELMEECRIHLKTFLLAGMQTIVVGDIRAFVDYFETGQALRDWNERHALRCRELEAS